jgi:hypothetical protein
LEQVTQEAPKPQEEVQKKQVAFITKGGGLNVEEVVKRHKAAQPELEFETVDCENHVEIYQVIRTKKK